MNKHVLFAAVAATLFAAPVHAIKINDHALTANGGSMADIQGTAPNVFDTLRTASNASQFAAVGRIGDCTGTWLGTEGDYAWVLTAARCVRNTNLVHNADHLTFTNKDGVALAGGAGSTSYIHPKRINRPISVRDAGTDIALVRLKRLPSSETAAPVAPVLYNGKAEVGVPVGFVAYGSAFVNNTNVNAVWPTEGERRAWGESRLDGVTENGHALFANFITGSTTNWGGLTTSDAGTAWWQERNGEWQIVATTSGGNSVQSLGARVSTYASWIRDLFPAVRVSSAPRVPEPGNAPEVTESTRFMSEVHGTNVSFLKSADQPEVDAPTSTFHSVTGGGWTTIRLPVTNAVTGESRTLRLQAQRYMTNCGFVSEMNNRIECPNYGGRLEVRFSPGDNLWLPGGTWRGFVSIDAVSGSTIVGQHPLDIDITVAQPAVRVAPGFSSGNLGAAVAFTVPTQSKASGPTAAHSQQATSGMSTVMVNARDAVTQTVTPIKLRAQRNNGCNDIAMNNAATCGQATSTLKVSFDPTDNPSLPAGRYAATFNVQAAVMNTGGFSTTLPIDLDLNLLP